MRLFFLGYISENVLYYLSSKPFPSSQSGHILEAH